VVASAAKRHEHYVIVVDADLFARPLNTQRMAGSELVEQRQAAHELSVAARNCLPLSRRSRDAVQCIDQGLEVRGILMKTHFVMMANYNEWANARLFRAAGTLKEALYRKEVGAYFRSLHGTLNHLLVADRIWMRRLKFSPICSIMKHTIAARLIRSSRYWVSRSLNHWTCS
jgi:hypothetical protein